MNPKVSIIIPIYNIAPYIKRCLDSVQSQSYHNIDCVLIDDCSTDMSMIIAEQFIRTYTGRINFYIISHQHNQGLSAARNTGINAAKGDYIYFMDGDDAITPDCIEYLVLLAKKYPYADYVQGNIITGSDKLMEGDIDSDVPEFCNDKKVLEDIILCKTHRTAWNRLIKRTFLLDNSLFFPINLVMEDHFWTYFVSKQAHAVVFCHKGTYYYFKNNNSIVNSPSRASLIKRYTSYISIFDAIIHDMLKRNDLQRCHRTYVSEALAFCMVNLTRLRSLQHWCVFWKYVLSIAWEVKTKFTWQRLLFLICMMPPFCFMIGVKGWRWRLRQYIAWKL